MSAEQKKDSIVHDDLLDHNYDGIQEYDNPTPSWWHMIFLGTMLFSVFYIVVMHLSPITRTRYEVLAQHQEAALEKQFGELRRIPLGEEKIRKALENEQWVAMGATIFEERCVLCHAEGGRGIQGLGLNLTDDVYKNIETAGDILNVLTNGIGTAMPSQRANLDDNEMALVAAYVVSLRNTNHPQGIPPEGKPIPPFFSDTPTEQPASGG
ncbi:MAG: cytochrome C oxidase Cbb3 [Planctomycetota bacterium]|nr:MAG: cytochrome C oxidase Cbb3 [Planctomycetota bacterium]